MARTAQPDAMRSSAARAFAHRRWWIQDPDCIVVRPPMSDDEARCWASWVALTTGAAVDSDELGVLPEERLEILRRVLPVRRDRRATKGSEATTLQGIYMNPAEGRYAVRDIY